MRPVSRQDGFRELWMNPLDWTGPQFVMAYAVFLVAMCLAGLLWQHLLNQPSGTPEAHELDLGAYEVAVLDDADTAVKAAVLALVHGKSLNYEEGTLSAARGVAAAVEEEAAAEAAGVVAGIEASRASGARGSRALQLVPQELHRPGRITLHPVRELLLREGEELPGTKAGLQQQQPVERPPLLRELPFEAAERVEVVELALAPPGQTVRQDWQQMTQRMLLDEGRATEHLAARGVSRADQQRRQEEREGALHVEGGGLGGGLRPQVPQAGLEVRAVEQHAIIVHPRQVQLGFVEDRELQQVPIVMEHLEPMRRLAHLQDDALAVGQPAQVLTERLLCTRDRDHEEVMVRPRVWRTPALGHRAHRDQSQHAGIGLQPGSQSLSE